MARVITDHRAFLIEARDKVVRVNELKADENRLSQEVKKLEKTIAAEKKAVQDEISITIKRRREEISSSYDREIGKDQDKLKKVRSRREKARNQGMKERIAEETKELDERNKELNSQIKTLFRQNDIPGFCNSLFYYSLYFTRGIKEISIFLLTFLICFLGIPCGIYYLIPGRSYLYLVVIYLAAILLFAGLYFTVYNKTKLHHLEGLRQGRQMRNEISKNKKKIKAIASTIKKDKDEELYGLEQFDDEISKLEGQVSLTQKRKEEALASFESVTKNILTDEITANSQGRLDGLCASYEDIAREKEQVEKEMKELSIYITDNYEAYLGRDFLQLERLDKLIEIITDKGAENITEAINLYKTQHQ